jgi:putative tryptophan/tyrosine transport system substrate-binding protein
VQAAAAAMGQQLEIIAAATTRDISLAFSEAVRKQADALLIHADPMFTNRRVQLATLAARYAIPAIYSSREFAEVGGLMSYGANLADIYRQIGTYTGRILKGTKPADLPVVQPTKFEFVINLATAKALGLTVPDSLLARADEVIE